MQKTKNSLKKLFVSLLRTQFYAYYAVIKYV